MSSFWWNFRYWLYRELSFWQFPWWRHQMEIFSALLAICAVNSPVPGEFPAQRPVTRSFDVLFDPGLNKQLSKQLWGWWFETLSCSLWRHCNASATSDGNFIKMTSLIKEPFHPETCHYVITVTSHKCHDNSIFVQQLFGLRTRKTGNLHIVSSEGNPPVILTKRQYCGERSHVKT